MKTLQKPLQLSSLMRIRLYFSLRTKFLVLFIFLMLCIKKCRYRVPGFEPSYPYHILCQIDVNSNRTHATLMTYDGSKP